MATGSARRPAVLPSGSRAGDDDDDDGLAAAAGGLGVGDPVEDDERAHFGKG